MKKLTLFEPEWSIAKDMGTLKSQLLVIADRYVGANPPTTFRVRAVGRDQFVQSSDGSWKLDLTSKLGAGTYGYSIIGGILMSGLEKTVTIGITCFSPVELYVNDNLIFRSTFTDEINQNLWHSIDAELKQGRNTLTLLCRRTAAGFGCQISLPQTTVLSPLEGREGQAGWVWSDLLETKPVWKSEAGDGLDWNSEEFDLIHWNPDTEKEAIGAVTPQQRLFPEGGGYCIAWCKLERGAENAKACSLVIESFGYNKVYLGEELLLACEAGTFEIPVPLNGGADLKVISRCTGMAYGAIVRTKGCGILSPGKINGTFESWVYTGCFESEWEAKQEELFNILVMPGGKRWLLDSKNLCLRTFFEGSYGDKYWVSQGEVLLEGGIIRWE